MRIKAITTFITDEGKVVSPGTETDVPRTLGDYLLDQGAAIQVEGGKGSHGQLVDAETVAEVEQKAASPENMVQPKPKEKHKKADQ